MLVLSDVVGCFVWGGITYLFKIMPGMVDTTYRVGGDKLLNSNDDMK